MVARRALNLLSLGMLAGAAPSPAQTATVPLELGQTFKMTSRLLSEERTIDVTLPRGYQANPGRFPVIVVLDAESQHEVVAAAARFYGSTGAMPPAIVVGIRNTDRTRDLTPPSRDGFRPPPDAGTSVGGADRFLSFITGELLPRIDRDYRTAPMRVLVGHSLGGLFALHALGAQPDLFTGYVVMEPAIWWNNEWEWRRAREVLSLPAARRARVILVNTPQLGVDTTQWGGSAPMVRQLSAPGETHESMAASGVLLSLRTMFADFRPTEWRPGTRPVAMLEHFDSLGERLGFAFPIPQSAYQQTIRMSIHARHWEDAERMLARMEQAYGTSASGDLRALLAEERATPAPTGLIPLEIPSHRPTSVEAAKFLGRWTKVGGGADRGHEITVSASGDTIVVHDRIQFPDGSWDAGDHPVIQVTPRGTLEWGLPWFRGIAALLVLKGEIQPDGTMRVTREPRGWVPRGPGGEMNATTVFRRIP
ncbi:MAG: alpha/beta hydrolase [Gemmatimonadales bacterium]